MLIQDFIQFRSCGILTRYKGKIQITTKNTGFEGPTKMIC